MTVVHPIARAWLSTGGTGARNYDEFADDAEITEVIAANPASALSVEMPHLAPESLGKSFMAALPDARRRLTEQRERGAYRPADQVIVLYRISPPPGGEGQASYGLFAMVDTAQISTSADEPGLVIRNEDVFIEKVRERVALAEATGFLLSPVLLLQTQRAAQLHEALVAAVAGAGEAAVTDADHVGRIHEVWPLPADSATAMQLMALAGGGELVVADGNHRSLAAQLGKLRRFLAVITTPASVTIQPYHRLITELPEPDVAKRLRDIGAAVHALDGQLGVPPKGIIHMYQREGAYRVELPTREGPLVETMDHARVERVVLRDAFGLDPADKRIVYVGGDYPVEWLVGEVDAGRADLAVIIAPVTVDDFVAVNLARQKMPRKSTWFVPKARAGLVLAELGAEG